MMSSLLQHIVFFCLNLSLSICAPHYSPNENMPQSAVINGISLKEEKTVYSSIAAFVNVQKNRLTRQETSPVHKTAGLLGVEFNSILEMNESSRYQETIQLERWIMEHNIHFGRNINLTISDTQNVTVNCDHDLTVYVDGWASALFSMHKSTVDGKGAGEVLASLKETYEWKTQVLALQPEDPLSKELAALLAGQRRVSVKCGSRGGDGDVAACRQMQEHVEVRVVRLQGDGEEDAENEEFSCQLKMTGGGWLNLSAKDTTAVRFADVELTNKFQAQMLFVFGQSFERRFFKIVPADKSEKALTVNVVVSSPSTVLGMAPQPTHEGLKGKWTSNIGSFREVWNSTRLSQRAQTYVFRRKEFSMDEEALYGIMSFVQLYDISFKAQGVPLVLSAVEDPLDGTITMSTYPSVPRAVDVHMGENREVEDDPKTRLFTLFQWIFRKSPSGFLRYFIIQFQTHTMRIMFGPEVLVHRRARLLVTDGERDIVTASWATGEQNTHSTTFRLPKNSSSSSRLTKINRNNWRLVSGLGDELARPADHRRVAEQTLFDDDPQYFVFPSMLPIDKETTSPVNLGVGTVVSHEGATFPTRVVLQWGGNLYATTVWRCGGHGWHAGSQLQLFGHRFVVASLRDHNIWLSWSSAAHRLSSSLLQFQTSTQDNVVLEFQEKMIVAHPHPAQTAISVFVDAWKTDEPLFLIRQDELLQLPNDFVQTLNNKCQAATNVVSFQVGNDGKCAEQFLAEGRQAIAAYDSHYYPVRLFTGFKKGELEFLLPSEATVNSSILNRKLLTCVV
eukprot:GHVS01073792.1.p1 GENE.GHVS01073792.1~~GHVS01073792.1.p1  ORF type:complete len:789 (+),score=124.31 GHVS01073792.1:241-2607(+)